uniref:Uncharacterized protein n=1 Tax=Lotharella oceanica TaxID=641309 RepID=A0A7S2TPZ2_9EUKA|mmetsp:Transcript_22467/g.42198  ORF Transcript_22467/g.42198 Transcript_22467/m.42198 type:complete len:126 (+) Transcript_22467:30-407(+)
MSLNRRIVRVYRELKQSIRKKKKDFPFLKPLNRIFRNKMKNNKVQRKMVQHTEDYIVMLKSLQNYEELLKEEGWGEQRSQSDQLQNLAKYCGLEMPKPFLERQGLLKPEEKELAEPETQQEKHSS